jgi:hypothetical protein
MAMSLDQLTEIVDSARARADLRTYYGTDGTGAGFSGRMFDELALRDQSGELANSVTPFDIVAVKMLSVDIPRDVTYQLIDSESSLARELSEHLAQIDPSARIGTDQGKSLLDEPADAAWTLLKDQIGIGWVSAGKLLASKRPHLVPVYDNVVQCLLRPERGAAWSYFDESLRSNLRGRLVQARVDAEVPQTVSDLRVLDVILWMKHAEDHRAGRCAR